MKIKNKNNMKLLSEIETCIEMCSFSFKMSGRDFFTDRENKLRLVSDFVIKCPLVITGLKMDAFEV